jgi:hypothetical protein
MKKIRLAPIILTQRLKLKRLDRTLKTPTSKRVRPGMKRLNVRLLSSIAGAVLISRLLVPGIADAAAWSVVSSPNVGTQSELHAVASISANDVWAVGQGSNATSFQTLTEHWNGTAWSVVPSPNPASNDVLSGVAAVSTNDVWAVGKVNTSSPPVIEHWNGSLWTTVKPPRQAGFLQAVTAVSANDVWAVGESVGASGAFQTLVEHWNGHKWSVVSSPNFGTQANELNGVTSASANDIWAVGFAVNSSFGSTQTLTLHWNGTSWSIVSSPNPTINDDLRAVAAVSGTNVWAVGQAINGSSVQTLIEQWNGTNWSSVSSPAAGLLDGIAIVSATNIWAVGSFVDPNIGTTSTVIEQWNGTTWSVVSSPNPSTSENVLDGAAADSVSGQAWAVGEFFNTTASSRQTLAEFNP